MPLVAECLRVSFAEVVAPGEVQRELRLRFGLDIPQRVVEVILKKARQEKYQYAWSTIRRERAYRPNRQRLATLTFHQDQQRVLAQQEALLRGLRDFARDQRRVDWTGTSKPSTLWRATCWIEQVAVLDAYTRSTVIPLVSREAEIDRYVVASYAVYLQAEHMAGLDYLVTVVQGHMLANAIFLPDPETPTRKFTNTALYFDTLFLMRALGYDGDAWKEPCHELLTLLHETGATLCCFRHTVDEIQGVLAAGIRVLGRRATRMTYGVIKSSSSVNTPLRTFCSSATVWKGIFAASVSESLIVLLTQSMSTHG